MVRLTKRGHYFIIILLFAPIGFGLANVKSQSVAVEIKGSYEPINMKAIKAELGMTPTSARNIAKKKVAERGWSKKQWQCLNWIWGKEAAWKYDAVSPTKDHGIPQRNMPTHSKAERDAFLADPVGQIEWGLNYIAHRYETPCKAKSFWVANRWY